MNSPLNIGMLGMGGLGLAKNLAKGFKNRKEYEQTFNSGRRFKWG